MGEGVGVSGRGDGEVGPCGYMDPGGPDVNMQAQVVTPALDEVLGAGEGGGEGADEMNVVAVSGADDGGVTVKDLAKGSFIRE